MLHHFTKAYNSPRFQRLLARASVLLGPLLSLSKTPAAKPILQFLARPAAAISALPNWVLPATATVTAYHSVSGATQVTYSPAVSGDTIEVEVGGTVAQVVGISSTEHGTAKSYSITGNLPTGISVLGGFSSGGDFIVNSQQVVFSGTPTQSGSYQVGIKGWKNNNARGDSTPIYNITFQVISTGPSITEQPISTSAAWGSQAHFSASVTEAIGLQWRRNGTPLSDGAGVSGANSSSLTLSQLTAADDGAVYTLLVTGSNGSVTSNEATLSVSSTDFQRWRESHFTGDDRFDDNISGASADSDSDKRPNIYEFIYDSSPSSVDPVIPYTTTLEPGQNPVVRVQFPHNPNINDTKITLEVSSDLGASWVTLPSGQLTTTATNWTAHLTIGQGVSQYVRMRVTN